MADDADAIKSQAGCGGLQSSSAGLSDRQGVVAVQQAQVWIQLIAQCVGRALAQVLAPGLQRGLPSRFIPLNAEAEHQALRECSTGFDRLWLKPEWWALFGGRDQPFDRHVVAGVMVAVKSDVRS